MGRIITLIYGVCSYAAFFLTFLYAIGFLGNVLVPKSLDSGLTGPLGTALLVDMGLLALFAVQHSVMARPAFKRLPHERRVAGRRTQHLRPGQQPGA